MNNNLSPYWLIPFKKMSSQELNIHRRFTYLENVTIYAIFRQDECFISGGEYNVSVVFCFTSESDTPALICMSAHCHTNIYTYKLYVVYA